MLKHSIVAEKSIFEVQLSQKLVGFYLLLVVKARQDSHYVEFSLCRNIYAVILHCILFGGHGKCFIN